MKNLEFNPIVIHTWSRMHSGNNNFLTIEEHIIYKFDHKTAIKLSPNNKKVDLQSYEIEGWKESKELSFDYLKNDAMDVSNVATKDYEYFIVKFVNGRTVICKSYDEFIGIINK